MRRIFCRARRLGGFLRRSTRQRTDRKAHEKVAGLSIAEARELLDRLERSGGRNLEAKIGPDNGITISWV